MNNLKILLANEATSILHGKLAAKKAFETAKKTFVDGGLGSELPEISLSFNNINKGIDILDFLSEKKIFSSKSEARRAIANNGLKFNNTTVSEGKKFIELNDFNNKVLKISYGKKKHYLIKII